MIFVSEEKGSDIANELRNTMKIIINWLSMLNLSVNLEKTKIVQFVNYKQLQESLNIVVNEKTVEQVNNTDFLGVKIDANLNWKSHVEKVNNKLAKSVYALSILTNITSTDVAIKAYYGMVYPILTYGIMFWGNSVNVESTFRLQKKCLRIIFKLRKMQTLRDTFKKNEILTLTCIYILQICLFVKERNDIFIKKSDTKNNNRLQYKFDVCTVRPSSLILSKSAYLSGIQIFNHLPVCIKSQDRIQFKTKLKKWLIIKSFYNLNEYFTCLNT